MNLIDRINDELKHAMKNRDSTKLAAIRAVRNEIIKFNKSGSAEEISDAIIIKFIKGQIKQRQDSIAMFQQGNRPDLVSEEEGQMTLLKNLLPTQLDETEMAALIDQSIAAAGATGPKDMGQVMKTLMPLLKQTGKDCDNRLISEMVKARLTITP